MPYAVTVPLGPATVDLVGVRAGDRNAVTISITSGREPLDLTGITVAAQARETATAASAALTATVTVLDAAAGQIELRWPGAAVTTLLAGVGSWKGVWDLQLTEAGSDPVTVAAGKFLVEMDVTR